ncbi:MAG: hypothetical protein Q7T13_17185 [Polaromonas sp.]|nr:hypothetical protein [Polaromonas sp.]
MRYIKHAIIMRRSGVHPGTSACPLAGGCGKIGEPPNAAACKTIRAVSRHLKPGKEFVSF